MHFGSLFTVTVIKKNTEKLGRKGIFHHRTLRLYFMVKWSQDMNISQEPRSRNWSREHGRKVLPVSCSPCSACFLVSLRNTCPRMALSTASWLLHINHQSRKLPTDLPIGQSTWGYFLWACLQYLTATMNLRITIPWAATLKWIKRKKWSNWGMKQHYCCLVTVTILWPEVSPLHHCVLTYETVLS